MRETATSGLTADRGLDLLKFQGSPRNFEFNSFLGLAGYEAVRFVECLIDEGEIASLNSDSNEF